MNSSTVFNLWVSLRPVQWIKNGFVLIPLIFARKAFDLESFLLGISAAIVFCMMAGGTYLMNDLADLESDRKHPLKRHRPLAAGVLSPWLARLTASILILLASVAGAYIGKAFLVVLLTYLAIQLLYSHRFKKIVILDIFCVSAGFFLRVVAGGLAIQVAISHWLIICSVLLSMFLALAKRKHELTLLGSKEGGLHRKVLEDYTPYLLDQLIAVITACALLSYMLYSVSSETIERFGTDHMIYTSPFVLFGIFRYFYLIHKKNKGDAPEKVLLSDLPLLLDVILWIIVCMLVTYGIV
jgi:4-hydroxybenzoate polyprenyltransferase